MSIFCVALDDEPLALQLLREYIQKFPGLQLLHTFDDAVTGAQFLRKQPVDLLFVDINMPDINGLDLVRSLPYKPMVIFTTAYKKFALEGFELDALDYLLKPISFDRFSKAVNKAIDYQAYRNSPKLASGEALFVRSEYQLVKINLDEIEYIESIEDYLKIHRTREKPVMTLLTLKAVQEKLPAYRFVRIHRSYIVPLAKVRSLVNRKVTLTSTVLPVSESYIHVFDSWRGK